MHHLLTSFANQLSGKSACLVTLTPSPCKTNHGLLCLQRSKLFSFAIIDCALAVYTFIFLAHVHHFKQGFMFM